MESEDLCPVCKRPLGNDWNKHHLIPKQYKGKETVNLHRICHNKIHSVFTEKELYTTYHTIEKLLENIEMQAFVKWVSNKKPDFYARNKAMNSKKRRRR